MLTRMSSPGAQQTTPWAHKSGDLATTISAYVQSPGVHGLASKHLMTRVTAGVTHAWHTLLSIGMVITVEVHMQVHMFSVPAVKP